MKKELYLSATEADGHCALAYAKAVTDTRMAYAAKHRQCQLMADENAPCWHEERGLQIALHLLENITPEEFDMVLKRGSRIGNPPKDARYYADDHNQKLADELMRTLKNGSKAGFWNSHKQ
jgi:hypothetical protein